MEKAQCKSMTVNKSEINEFDELTVEYSSTFGNEYGTVELSDIEVDNPFNEDIPLEFTGYDENNQKYRIYLDKNKVELANDVNGNFKGCIGNLANIFETLE